MIKNFAIFLALILCNFASGARKSRTHFRSGTRSTRRPNIIFILVDDMDKELGSPNVMKKTQNILCQEGADFVNAFVTTPMCCPSRSSILTGKYAHNHFTFTNNWNCSSPSWRKGPERKTYARYLELAGYVTGYFGKYLNEYDGSWVPIGWKKWEGLLHNSKFYNYTVRHNTYKERHKMSYEHDYFTDLITNRSISFIRRAKASRPDSPFLAVLSHSAPHGPETPAPQYSTAFPDAKVPRLPNWNFVSQDKQWILRETKPMDAQKIAFVDLLHRRRLQTLLSVDDSVARIFSTLQSLGIENETYIFFTSDHGYHLGQFALVKGKSMPFESDIRVPFYVRGPSIPKNIRMKEMILNIDIAPTFLDIAGVNVPGDMDGSSIMRLFRKSRDGRRSKRRMHVRWRDTILIERSRGWRRTKSMLEANSRNSKMHKYPFEGVSRNRTVTGKERKLTLLENICSKIKHQSPCQPNQLWECLTLDGRPRLRKCRKNGAVQATTPTTTPPTPSTALTTPVKMCVCMKPRPGNGNQGDMLPYDEKWLEDGLDYLSAKELRRRSKRSRYQYNNRPRRNRNEFNARRYYKELARAQKLQNRRSKSKMLLRTPVTGTRTRSNATEAQTHRYDYAGVQEVVEEKLGKLKEKIWETRMRLGALRDRRKKLLLISARDRLIEYPCPCYPGNDTKPERATAASVRNGGNGGHDHADEEQQISPLKRRNKQPKAVSRKAEPKKKKAKTSIRRSKCSSPGMNCFYQTTDHWKLPPLWKGGEFCFCPNAANNSYWCLRTINATHNFLYCEFITHFLEFFDLNQDPYQLYNVIHEVDPAVLSELHQQLNEMRACKGENCNHYYGKKYADTDTTAAPLTTPVPTSIWTQTVATTSGMTSGETNVSSTENTINSPTAPSRIPDRLPSSLPSESHSEDIKNQSEGFASTSESSVDSSETTDSSEFLAVTSMTSTVGRIQTESLTTKQMEEETTRYGKEKTPEDNSGEEYTQESLKKKITTEESVMLPTNSVQNRSEDLGNSSQSVVNTTSTSVDASEAIKTTTFTISAPAKAKAETEQPTMKPIKRKSSKRRKEKNSHENGAREAEFTGEKAKSKSLKKSKKSKKKTPKIFVPLPTESMVPDKPLTTPRNIPYSFNTTTKSEKSKKPTGSPLTFTNGSEEVPTVFVNASEMEPSSLESRLPTTVTKSWTTIPREETTSDINLREYSTVKPIRRKSTKRRKHGEKEGKGPSKKSKKLKKGKKKSSGKGILLTPSNTSSSAENGETSKPSENQTRIDTNSESKRPKSGEHEDSKDNQASTEISRKRSKRPSGKRLNRNSKKRSKKPTKRPQTSQISEGGVNEGQTVSPEGGGDGFEQQLSPSDP